MKLLVNVLVSALAVLVTARVLPGVRVDGFGTAIVVAVLLGVATGALGPAILLLTLPLNIATLGLFTFVVIAALVLGVAALVPGFYILSFWWALAFALVLAFVNSILHALARA